MEEDFVVMLPDELGGFYIRSVELTELKKINLPTLNEVEKMYVHGMDFSDYTEITLSKENISISNFGYFIEALENELYPKELMNLNIDCKNGNKIYFNTGEVSLMIQDPVELENCVKSILQIYKFQDTNILNKLKGFENNYFTISPDEDFDPSSSVTFRNDLE